MDILKKIVYNLLELQHCPAFKTTKCRHCLLRIMREKFLTWMTRIKGQKKQGYPFKNGAYDRIDFDNVSINLFYRNIVGCSDQYYCMSKKQLTIIKWAKTSWTYTGWIKKSGISVILADFGNFFFNPSWLPILLKILQFLGFFYFSKGVNG